MGRKKIKSALGEKKNYSFWCYPSEIVLLKIEFEKIKRQRKKYEIKEEQ